MLPFLCAVLLLAVLALLLKLHILYRTLDSVTAQIDEKLKTDTNTPLVLPTRDRHMRRFTAALDDALSDLTQHRRRAAGNDRMLKQAVTNISHDLRTPLTAVCGYLELLQNEPLSENGARYLAVLKSRAAAMKRMTETLFRYTLTATEEAAPETVNLLDALSESLAQGFPALCGAGITPRITLPDDAVCRTLPRAALSRVLENILQNAAKYSDGDLSVWLTDSGEIFFQNRAEKLTAVQAARLFDRFYTVESAEGSTGLGLSIARDLTEQMGGTLSAAYRDGILTVTLRL